MQRAGRRQGYLSVTDGVSSTGDLPPPLSLALLPEPALARTRLAPVRAPDPRCHLLDRGKADFIGLHPPDFAPQPACFLEPQLPRAIAHPLSALLVVSPTTET